MNDAQKHWIDSVALWMRRAFTWKNESRQVSEIEMRFGMRGKGDTLFASGVGVQAWHRVKNMFFASLDHFLFAREPESVMEIVHLYDDNTRRIRHHDGTITQESKIALSHFDTDFTFPGSEYTENFCVRLSHNIEETLKESQEKHENAWSNAKMVRARARTTYYYKMWRIDLSTVQQGNTLTQLQCNPALYEIEVELIPSEIDWSQHDYHYLASSLYTQLCSISQALCNVPQNALAVPMEKK